MKNIKSITIKLSILLILSSFFFTHLAHGEFITPTPLWACGGHDYIVYSVAYSPDGKIIASASADKLIKLGMRLPVIYGLRLSDMLTSLNRSFSVRIAKPSSPEAMITR